MGANRSIEGEMNKVKSDKGKDKNGGYKNER